MTAAFAAAGSIHGQHMSFSLSLPLLVFAAGSLAGAAEGRIGGEMARSLLACGLAVPAVNVWYAALLTKVDGLMYLAPERGLFECFSGAAGVTRSSGPLLFGAAVGMLVLLGRRGMSVAAIFLAGAAGARLGRLILRGAAAAMRSGDAPLASRLCLLAALCSLLLLLAPLGIGLVRASSRPARLSLVLLAALVTLASSPPVVQLVRLLPVPEVNVEVPRGEPGLSWSLAPIGLRADDLEERLLRKRHYRTRDSGWYCIWTPDVPWWERVRGTVAAGLQADAPAAEILQVQPMLSAYGVDRLVLIGRSEPTVSILDPWMGWPGAPVFLDKPPFGRWLRVGNSGWSWLEPEESEPLCVALLEDDATVGALYQAVRELTRPGEACALGVALAPMGGSDALPPLGCP